MNSPNARTPAPAPYERRRQYERTPLRMSAEIHLGDDSFTATTRDLSEGGCGLELSRPVDDGTELTRKVIKRGAAVLLIQFLLVCIASALSCLWYQSL